MAYLKLGQVDQAMTDYDEALKNVVPSLRRVRSTAAASPSC